MLTRQERRQEARLNGVSFEPQYKGRVIEKSQYDKEVIELKEERKKMLEVLTGKKESSNEEVSNEQTT